MTQIEVADQLADEMHLMAMTLVGLGVRSASPLDQPIAGEIEAAAQLLAAHLTQDVDARLAGQACIDVMNALWPETTPEERGRPEWWNSPLGRTCARSIGTDEAEAVTYTVAAAMLGRPRGSVGAMANRGQLKKHPKGGVLRSSIMQYLASGRHSR